MFILYFIPYLKWLLFSGTLLFYYLSFPLYKNRVLYILHLVFSFFFFIKVLGADILRITKYVGTYSDLCIELLFFLTLFALLICFLFVKIKPAKKVLAGFVLLITLAAVMPEVFYFAVGGWQLGPQVEKYYVLNNAFTVRKNFLDYGYPQQYTLVQRKYILFEKERGLMFELDGREDFDSINYLSFEKNHLKFAIYKKNERWVKAVFLKYDMVQPSFCGLSKVSLNGKSGFIDKSGKEIIPPQYDGLGDPDCGSGLCMASRELKVGYINNGGTVIIPFKYDAGGNFKNGRATVQLNGKYMSIDCNGKEYAFNQ